VHKAVDTYTEVKAQKLLAAITNDRLGHAWELALPDQEDSMAAARNRATASRGLERVSWRLTSGLADLMAYAAVENQDRLRLTDEQRVWQGF
jgi:hypothetical protein